MMMFGSFIVGIVIGAVGSGIALAAFLFWLAKGGHIASLNKFRARWRGKAWAD
jgi:hypothetical protein